MAILITGVNGMIGYPLALELSKEGRQIVGVDIKIPNDAKQQDVEFLEADITRVDLVNDIIASRNIDCIVQVVYQGQCCIRMTHTKCLTLILPVH